MPRYPSPSWLVEDQDSAVTSGKERRLHHVIYHRSSSPAAATGAASSGPNPGMLRLASAGPGCEGVCATHAGEETVTWALPQRRESEPASQLCLSGERKAYGVGMPGSEHPAKLIESLDSGPIGPCGSAPRCPGQPQPTPLSQLIDEVGAGTKHRPATPSSKQPPAESDCSASKRTS
jgi:hypothetical protein